jgi:hypothetical protein
MNLNEIAGYQNKCVPGIPDKPENIFESICIKTNHNRGKNNFRQNRSNTECKTRTYRLQLYKRALAQMLNDPVYLTYGYFDRGICSFINASGGEYTSIRHLPELYKQRPWYSFFQPGRYWWKLNKKSSALKRLKTVQKAIKALESKTLKCPN